MSGPVFHGGGLDGAIAVHGGRREDWLDLSTGINPVSWPLSRLAGGLPAQAWTRLPDSEAEANLIAAARRAYRVPPALDIVAAPGTQALIETLPRILPGGTATVVSPAAGTYREHAHCCAKAGRQIRLAGRPEQVAEDESLAILVNPNNPDGQVWPRRDIAALAGRLGGGTLVVDEAFCDATPGASVIADALPNAVVLRSFGKFFGLAGLRLGFAVCAPALAERLRDRFGPWAVSGPALAAGAAALADEAWIETTRSRLQTDSSSLANTLEKKGFSIAGRNSLFVLARHGAASAVAAGLARRRILVRPFPDRPELLRFGLCAGDEALSRLDSALCDIMGELA